MLRRRAPLRARKWLRRRSSGDQNAAFRAAVLGRARHQCEAQLSGCTRVAVHAHHRRRRSQGGTDHPDNGVAVCAQCHWWIHAHPARAFELGLLERRTAQ